ncbi:NADH-plastoquinone oxidoreductase subunit 7 (chloroplast), partial [Olea europaea subsp. europaea]
KKIGDQSIFPWRWRIRSPGFINLQIPPQLVKRMKLAGIMTILGSQNMKLVSNTTYREKRSGLAGLVKKIGDQSIFPWRWKIRPPGFINLQILPQVVKRMKFPGIMTILAGEKNLVQKLWASSFQVVMLVTRSESSNSSALSRKVCGNNRSLIASSEIPWSVNVVFMVVDFELKVIVVVLIGGGLWCCYAGCVNLFVVTLCDQ